MKLTPRTGRLLAAVFVLAVAGIAGLATPAASSAATTALASPPIPVLTSIRAAHYRGYDRVTFQFAGPLPARFRVRYVARQASDGGGSARLVVSFTRASGRDSQGRATYGAARRSYALPGVIQIVTEHDLRRSVSFALWLVRRETVHTFSRTHPSRVVIEVRTPNPTASVHDYFVSDRGATVAVDRPEIRSAQISSALRRLFAGPTQAELDSGLRFVASGSTGFRYLQISNGIAQVELTGGCNSGGSTVTVASEIMPTLRQFPSVRWVKIYDPAGSTGHPGGLADSIPQCLTLTGAQLMRVWLQGPGGILLLIVTGLGVLLGLILTALSILAGLALRPSLITPSAYLAERVAARPVGTGQFEPDIAWPLYPLRQVRADLARISADCRARYRRLWKWPFRPIIFFLLLPISLTALVCLPIAGLTMMVIFGLFALVSWTLAAVVALCFAVALIALRGTEACWHRVMRTEASCPHPGCYQVTARPAYKCPGCSALHRDIRPGRLGLFTRRCVCGALLPTMVLRAAWRLQAVCQRCEKPLRSGSAAVRDVRVPIFGDTSAGKTRFLYAALDSLVDTTSRAKIPFGFPDEDSENDATLALDLIRSGQDTAKTSTTLPTALTCRLGGGRRGTLVHLFDAAGEHFRGAEMHDSLAFLDHGHGLVYVLDPFSVGSVRDLMTGHNAVVIRLAHVAAGDPESAYTEVVTRLRDSGVDAAGQRLAIVVSKTDLLCAGGLKPPVDSDAIAAWLTEIGVHNLVLSARREFAEVRYFTVASLAAGQARRGSDAGAPLRWLLSCRGVRLPADPLPADPQPTGSPDARSGRRAGHDSQPGGTDQAGAEQDETAKAQP
jgi:Double-GTPase 2/Sporulation and spore germination